MPFLSYPLGAPLGDRAPRPTATTGPAATPESNQGHALPQDDQGHASPEDNTEHATVQDTTGHGTVT